MSDTPEMRAFRSQHSVADAIVAKARDNDARQVFGNMYNDYQQGTLQAITERFTHPPPQPAAHNTKVVGREGERTQWNCSLCPPAFTVHDFDRHNQETHIKDPGRTFFCPVPTCAAKKIYRAEASAIDEHLASHNLFLNTTPGSKADKFVNGLNPSLLGKLPLNTLVHLAEADRAKVEAITTRKNDTLRQLPTDLQEPFTIEELTIPRGLIDDAKPDLNSMKKAGLVSYIIELRKTLGKWEDGFTEAKMFLDGVGKD
ncbi:hypothetical protein VM1G_05897 [Cytospora mali]|uniref:Uncharacterized protein n=1 Tax=Cytospora mali TaxID=578113 RepID=A0A194W391_CYTMA|nr:hypothetical protein VM1G_05897 [Valsa mali]